MGTIGNRHEASFYVLSKNKKNIVLSGKRYFCFFVCTIEMGSKGTLYWRDSMLATKYSYIRLKFRKIKLSSSLLIRLRTRTSDPVFVYAKSRFSYDSMML